MQEYIIKQKYFENVTTHQKAEMLKPFSLNENGDIITSFAHKGYTCNNLPNDYSSDVMAISMFSGAGGLDIGSQLAGVKVLSSLDIFNTRTRYQERTEESDHKEENFDSNDINFYNYFS